MSETINNNVQRIIGKKLDQQDLEPINQNLGRKENVWLALIWILIAIDSDISFPFFFYSPSMQFFIIFRSRFGSWKLELDGRMDSMTSYIDIQQTLNWLTNVNTLTWDSVQSFCTNLRCIPNTVAEFSLVNVLCCFTTIWFHFFLYQRKTI